MPGTRTTAQPPFVLSGVEGWTLVHVRPVIHLVFEPHPTPAGRA